ncbi:hypothetical protein J1N35_006453 [Gossypium stocksii]|uniref:Sulfotransferase n=1 Tax=Gossypium stocksii TaxID=47602 RepID=A0A9D3WH90_9ROSI|nr:hypothetical protein J1N35_006453 [Gossypium stocksii]
MIADIEELSSAEAIERVMEFMSTIPTENGWNAFQPLRLYEGFWTFPHFLESIILAQHRFKPKPGDIFLCSAPKSGTTWLKALSFAIVTRNLYDTSNSPLLTKGPHHCVPNMVGFEHKPDIRQPGIPLVPTHAPYHCLPKSVLGSDDIKVVYIYRDPKDAFVSMFRFAAKRRPKENEHISIEEAFELFCQGRSVFGPAWDHILGYWKASQERPEKVMFLKYEELMNDSELYVKKLAEFIGYPFSFEEEQGGVVKKLIDLCSFENLSNLDVNKTGKRHEEDDEATNKTFFRKGKVGDWQNHLTPEMANRLDNIVEQKLSGTGLSFELNNGSS